MSHFIAMKKLLAVCVGRRLGQFRHPNLRPGKTDTQAGAGDSAVGSQGLLDHVGVDLQEKHLFVAAAGNNTLELVDVTDGKVIKSLRGFKDAQDALFLVVTSTNSTSPVSMAIYGFSKARASG
jgi:hypothetical protein